MTPSQGKAGKIDIEALFNWLEQQPELEHLRARADGALCEYKPGEQTAQERITVNDKLEIGANKKSWFRGLKEIVWVPAQNMRGTAFATHELDASLGSVAKLMSISSLWDFFTTIPLFQFSLSGPLGLASGPGAIVLSFLLLYASNTSGENATNRSKGHGSKATWSLAAFVVLCTAKTLFSGVGVDLWIGAKGIASTYAAELAATKLARDKTELKRLQTGGADFEAAARSCSDLEQQMKSLDRNRNETQYISLFVRAYGPNAVTVADRGLSPPQLIERYGSVGSIPGVCRQRNVLRALNIEKAKPLEASIERKSQALAQKPPLAFLEQEEPELFREHFRNVNGRFEWVNGTEAVGQATNQFYANLFAGKFGLLGFSLFTLSVSVILTGAAAIMLYLISLNTQVKASFTEDLKEFRDKRLEEYQQRIVTENLNRED
ncbi:hypothetical protein [Synechococcus sp. CBW1006]|uniref:hypothetical protein n=1 Tax=Synechococcus sp. CBW1006 TaxID=1353138 RepID=UPI0018CE6D00|nr:hypothetical protein [Synechococcus sp. CBW1006]QPN66544.1 hypothetical protein H8F26_17775 [Synechococcus sp. CBW1006]